MMKKFFLFITILTITIIPLLADSESLNTEITTVSMGPHNFGFGLAPTGTNFVYSASIQLHPKLQYPGNFSIRLDFSNPNNIYFGGYNYKTGTPIWINKYINIKDMPDYFVSGYYFKPTAQVNVSFSQGFGTNPVAGAGYLINLGLDLNSTYSMALESLDVHKGMKDPVFIDKSTTHRRYPFTTGTDIPGYPWLQDDRNTLSNYMRFSAYINLTKSKGLGVSDGLSISAAFEYGPSWLGNALSMQKATTDFYGFSTSITQTLALYVKKQTNGLNWLSIGLVHSNSYNYTDGSIVPYHKLPGDRLNNTFSDFVGISFYGPQFIAWDCYSDITLGLSNSCYFGHIVNEASKNTFASEWNSSLNVQFHLRLFGFMHFRYMIGYTFYTGINISHPYFWQEPKVSFYISL